MNLRFLLLPLFVTGALAQVPTPAPASASALSALMASGDTAADRYDTSTALKDYLSALKLEPNHVPLMLRIARQYRHLMAEASGAEQKLKLGQLSLVHAKRASELAVTDSEAQLSPAISHGKMLPLQSSREQYAALSVVKKATDKALRLNPRNDYAWHVLGLWHRNLASVGSIKRSIGGMLYGTLPASTFAEAVTCFEKAIAINPNRLRHHVELGITYAAMANPAAARTHLKAGLALRNTEKDDVELRTKGKASLAALPKP